MAIKKLLLFVSLFVFTATLGFAITRDNVDTKDEEAKKTPYEKEIQKARNFYCEGNFEKAEESINLVLSASPDNEKASELNNKIMLLKERELFYKRTLVNDYLIELRRTVKEGNYYEGFMFIEKIKALSPEENVKTFYNRLRSEKDVVIYSLENSSDKKIFNESIDYFVNGKYSKATNLVYKLYEKYPKFSDYVGMCRYYSLKETNAKRIKTLYNKAVKYFKETKLGKARNYADMCYSLDSSDLKLKLLVDQINMEII